MMRYTMLSGRRNTRESHKKGLESYVKAGFKNSKANGGIKELPMMPEAYLALSPLYQDGATGLIFQVNGTHLEYRTIQHAYDKAFGMAGLPYTGTHVMRHGGCRRVYNREGDVAVAQQLLGNADLKSALVYAQRHKGALTQVVGKEWDQFEEKKAELVANGRKAG